MIREMRKIEPWKTDDSDLKAALALQAERKAAGISVGQLAYLLGLERATYLSYERAETRCPPLSRARIKEVLDQVKAGTLEVPNLNREV